MEQIITLILESGRTAIDMVLYVLLPVMVVMLALMKLLESKGVLGWVSNKLTPFVRLFGMPGLGIFAMLQILFVSFNAPVATLAIMARDGTSRRSIAATLAAVLTMSQANVVFPMAVVGLDVPVIMATSILGGLIAAAATYYLFARNPALDDDYSHASHLAPELHEHKNVIQTLSDGGQEGVKIVLASIPLLILALCFVNLLKVTGTIELLTALLAPVLALVNLPESTVLPIVTKFIAGGTAMMGVTIDLLNQGAMSATDLNRIAGFVLSPFDLAGTAILLAAGKRVSSVARAAILGALIGTFVRGALHLIIF
ncbi:nucleoside recognition family protein [Amphritea sp. 2_MG-2023]|jgi:spore maturation protein SpmB|uniref:nucleoside recognition domain-containing protein n=1 Tax=Amphritea TaxID=515417 RepID=UPI001C07A039|nr:MULTISPECIES: nucleoside recognition domain-containing protein [Amphritea]MBU2966046.1 nucleoside recognition family protein [Amphritea atlantica]MDO6418136.1 nucleoside recognition family protein [Amphritea sp. 2_MG-2023]